MAKSRATPSRARATRRRPSLPTRTALLARLRLASPRTRELALLGAPLTAAKLAVIERRLGVPLPEPLRGFVLAVGNGGRGPRGTWFTIADGVAKLASPTDAAAEPPFAPRVLDRAIAEKRTDESYVLHDPDEEEPPLCGVLPVADAGDGLLYAVVMQGKHAGQVWLVGEAWSPELDAASKPVDFVAWYLAGLDGAAPTVTTTTASTTAIDPSWPKALRAALEKPAKARKLGLNDFAGPKLPDVFDRLPNLEELSISQCTATALPSSMRALVGLRRLWLSSMKNLVDLEAITSLRGLKLLNLSRSSQIELPASITGLASLEVLVLSFTKLTSLPAALVELPRLHRLDLDLCFQLDLRQAWPVIARLPALRALTLSKSRLVRWPSTLHRPPKLEQLDLREAELPAGQLDRVRAALPGVSILV